MSQILNAFRRKAPPLPPKVDATAATPPLLEPSSETAKGGSSSSDVLSSLNSTPLIIKAVENKMEEHVFDANVATIAPEDAFMRSMQEDVKYHSPKGLLKMLLSRLK